MQILNKPVPHVHRLLKLREGSYKLTTLQVVIHVETYKKAFFF